jgi:hypothetical protein
LLDENATAASLPSEMQQFLDWGVNILFYHGLAGEWIFCLGIYSVLLGGPEAGTWLLGTLVVFTLE